MKTIFYLYGKKISRKKAEDRCHRIGQENKVVYVDISCSGTIDDRILAALSSKGDVVRSFKAEVEKVKGKKARLKELIESL